MPSVLQYSSLYYLLGWLVFSGPLLSWIELLILERRKASAAAVTYSFGAILSFWGPGMIMVVADFIELTLWTNLIGHIGGYLLMLLGLIQHYIDLRKTRIFAEAKNRSLE